MMKKEQLVVLMLFFLGLFGKSQSFPTRTTTMESFRKDNSCVRATQQNDNLLEPADAMALLQQAKTLRNEAELLRKELNEAEKARIRNNIENVDRWLDELLINMRIDESTEMLNTEEQVVKLIKEKRFGAEHINKIFDRICEISPNQSIDNCSPMISLLLDAACKVDCMERKDNPNKRWNHRVERDLRKKLFAMGWGINLDEVQSKEKTRSLAGDKDYS